MDKDVMCEIEWKRIIVCVFNYNLKQNLSIEKKMPNNQLGSMGWKTLVKLIDGFTIRQVKAIFWKQNK